MGFREKGLAIGGRHHRDGELLDEVLELLEAPLFRQPESVLVAAINEGPSVPVAESDEAAPAIQIPRLPIVASETLHPANWSINPPRTSYALPAAG